MTALPNRYDFVWFADRMLDEAANLQGFGPRAFDYLDDQWPEAVFFAQTLCDLFAWLDGAEPSWRACWALDEPRWFELLVRRFELLVRRADWCATHLFHAKRICPVGLWRFRSIADAIWREALRRRLSTGASSLCEVLP